jgi:hypothetical protein
VAAPQDEGLPVLMVRSAVAPRVSNHAPRMHSRDSSEAETYLICSAAFVALIVLLKAVLV